MSPEKSVTPLRPGSYSRRDFLKTAGRFGLMAGFLAACGDAGSVATTLAGSTTAPGGSAPATSAPTGSLDPSAVDVMNFVAWEHEPEQIQAFLDAWTEQTGIPNNLELIPNVGYPGALQTRIIGGAQPDVFYNFTYSTQKFVDEGWARTMSDLPGVDAVMDDMFESARSRYMNAAGEVISLPYFSAVHLLHYNERHLADAGFDGPPETFSELYDQCEKLQADGISEFPYAGYWVKQFCEEYLMVYLLAEGIVPFDAEGQPVFADDSRSVGVFEWWQSMYQDGLVTPTILTDTPDAHTLNMANGTASFFTLHHYFLKAIRDLEGDESSNVVFSYRHPGAEGTNFQMGEVLQMGGHLEPGPRLDAAWDLMRYYGWKHTEDGNYDVHMAWAEASALLAPYPAFFEAAASVFPEYYDMAQLSDAFQSGDPVAGRNASWYSGYVELVGDRVHALLLGEATPQETVDGLAEDAMRLASEA